MIKLRKPPHTAGICVRALHDSSRRELSFNGTEKKLPRCRTVRGPDQSEIYKCEDDIRELLSSPIDRNFTEQNAYDLSEKLKHMESHPEEDGGLVYLYRKILTPAYISTMWKIAGYNRRNQAADMLPLKNQPCVKWGGKSANIIDDRKRKRGDEDLKKPLKEFPLEGKWEMELQRCGDGEAYNVVFKGKSGWSSIEKKGLVFVEKDVNGIPGGVEPFDFAIVFGARGPWPSSNHFVIYMRAAGPNVLIGQAWTGGENSKRLWAEVVLVKRK